MELGFDAEERQVLKAGSGQWKATLKAPTTGETLTDEVGKVAQEDGVSQKSIMAAVPPGVKLALRMVRGSSLINNSF